LEALYKKIHAEIRKNPKRTKPDRKNAPVRKIISKDGDKREVRQNFAKKSWVRNRKLTRAERKARVAAKIQAAISKQSGKK